MSSVVNHPSHYNQYPVEVIKLIDGLSFPLGNVIKYLLRAPFKGNLEDDIAKAKWYAKYVMENDSFHLIMKVEEFNTDMLMQFCSVIKDNVKDELTATGIMVALTEYYWAMQDDPNGDASTAFEASLKRRNTFLKSVCNIKVDSVQDKEEEQECDEKSSCSWHIVLKERPDKIHVSVESKSEGDPSTKAFIVYVTLMAMLESAVSQRALA